jgi:hypothetical protein
MFGKQADQITYWLRAEKNRKVVSKWFSEYGPDHVLAGEGDGQHEVVRNQTQITYILSATKSHEGVSKGFLQLKLLQTC